MSLQRRLTLFFIVIVILPLGVAGYVVQRVVVGEIERRAFMSVGPALDGAIALYNERVEAVDERAAAVAAHQARIVRLLRGSDAGEIERFLRGRLSDIPGLDFVIALDRNDELLAFVRKEAGFVEGVDVPGARAILARTGPTRAYARSPVVPVRVAGGPKVGSIVAGFWIDGSLLLPPAQGDTHMAVVSGGKVVASTAPLNRPETVDLGYEEAFEVDLDGEGTARAVNLQDDVSLLAWSPVAPIANRAQLVRTAFIALLGVALVATTALAYFLARLVTQDLEELSRGAIAIAQGRFDHRIPVRSHDEVGRLATVFNEMSERLQATITELQQSRDQLERAVRRVGETLRSTHDMSQILDSILRTAADAVDADAAALWKFLPTRDELQPVMVAGIQAEQLPRLRVGEGVVGLVAERGVRLSLPDERGGPRPARAEPDFPVVVAVPLFSQDRITGVITAYRSDASRPFGAKDLDTVTFLAEQGGVAIENVALHEEASRLSLTDGLTGVYNRRYFQMQFRQVMATAIRFNRPFSVLMLDLDHFKAVNDTYGHQRGDSVLIEFARRVTSELREVDTFTRWGGEEFMCLLPETNVEGAHATAQKILDVIRAEPFDADGYRPLRVTTSIGIASYPDHGGSFRGLVEAVDKALYAAKQQGRDRLAVAGREPPPQLKVAE